MTLGEALATIGGVVVVFAAVLWIVVAGLVGYGIAHYWDAVRVDYAEDFKPLFRGPRAFWRGEGLYDLQKIIANHLGTTYKYPPFFAILMGPLTGLTFSMAIHIWRGFNVLLIIAAAVFLWRWSGRPFRSWSTLALAYLVVGFQPLADTLGYAQVDIIVLVGGDG